MTRPIMPMVLLSAITIGKTNPRKVFDEDAINELAASIKEKGVIQPILLRPSGKPGSYELVCGERRYRASLLAGLKEIPAYVKEMTDDEALQAQITENLQRKDVHPLEEAYAFKQMMDKHPVEEIAAKVGKKVYYIRQRLKLNDLTENWQKLFYKNLLPVSIALKVAILPAESQKELLEDEGIDDDNVNGWGRNIGINEYQLRRSTGKLNNAPFDTKDALLDKKMGACTTCPFNSAVGALFPEDEQTPTCSNVTCFAHKCDLNFEAQLKVALEDPTITLISCNWSIDKKVQERYQKLGHTVLSDGAYDAIEEDNDKPNLAEFRNENEDDYDTEAELMEAYNNAVKEYEEEKQKIDKKIAAGKCIKALFIDGPKKGGYTYIEIRKSAAKSSNSVGTATNPDEQTAAAIDFEIGKIRDRQKRNKELDAEKVHKRIVETVQEDKSMKELPKAFSPNDRVMMLFLLCDFGGYAVKEKVKKMLGLSLGYDMPKGDKLYPQLEALNDEQLAYLVRQIILAKYNTNLPNSAGGYMLRKLAEDLGTIPIEAYEIEQSEKAEKRQKNVDKRIAELQAQKKELKPKTEKPTPKQFTKKVIVKK